MQLGRELPSPGRNSRSGVGAFAVPESGSRPYLARNRSRSTRPAGSWVAS